MKKILVKDILEITKGRLITGNLEAECVDFSKDTRDIKIGDTYIGIKGEKFNGNEFWNLALDNGANVVIVEKIEFDNLNLEKYIKENKTIILVEDSLEALYKIAAYKRQISGIKVVAITGSVGKTSTKDIIANVISKKYKTLKTIGNNNNNIGMPFTILRLKDEEVAVLEMGMNHLGEIELLSKIAKPDICVITNVGTSHIGNLGSRENILKAKLEILSGSENPKVVINIDNDMLYKWYQENKENKNIHTYSINEKSNLKAEDIKLDLESSTFKVLGENIKVPVAGEHFVLNALSAITVGKLINIENDIIIKGIESFELTKKRMEIVNTDSGIKIINDAYNASYDSMIASIKTLEGYEKNRKVAVLGDMKELGDFSEEIHKSLGEYINNTNIDILICSGKYSKYIYDEVKDNDNIKSYYSTDNEQIVEITKEIALENDVILIKASNGMKFYEIASKLIKTI